MSTNFYYQPPATKDDPVPERLHIGKRSVGWAFGFRGYPGLEAREDWELMIADASGTIVDENGVTYTPEDFWSAVDQTRKPLPSGRLPSRRYRERGRYGLPRCTPNGHVDPDGWDFTNVEFW